MLYLARYGELALESPPVRSRFERHTFSFPEESLYEKKGRMADALSRALR